MTIAKRRKLKTETVQKGVMSKCIYSDAGPCRKTPREQSSRAAEPHPPMTERRDKKEKDIENRERHREKRKILRRTGREKVRETERK